MLHIFGERRAAFGICLMVGVCLILCMGAAALAAEATLKGKPGDGTMAAIAVPNFINYRNKSRVAAGVGTAEGVRVEGIDGTDEEEDSEILVEQDQRPRGEPQPAGLKDKTGIKAGSDSGTSRWYWRDEPQNQAK
jgi:hypothetical protein